MFRLPSGTREIFIVPEERIRNDPAAMRTVEGGAALFAAITGGALRFTVAEQAPAGALSFPLTINPGDTRLVGAVAVASRQVRNSAIQGGEVVFATLGTVRTSTTVHELGHVFGLEHSRDGADVMSPGRASRVGVEEFSDREQLVIRMMMQRPPGNARPDNDRNASSAQSTTTVSTIRCSLRSSLD